MSIATSTKNGDDAIYSCKVNLIQRRHNLKLCHSVCRKIVDVKGVWYKQHLLSLCPVRDTNNSWLKHLETAPCNASSAFLNPRVQDIRPEVNDARVHFALNCASISCPPLRRTLFTGANLDSELDEVPSICTNTNPSENT